jgi:4-amino-4-deoxy-L-arabinose transferase-like glycosyltransferase
VFEPLAPSTSELTATAPAVTPRTFTAALSLLALLPRLYVAIAWSREPVWDGHYYDIGARSIAAGLGYVGTSGGAWCHYPVGYSALLGGAYRLVGEGQHVGPVLNALCGALLAVVIYRLARHVTSEGRARIAGLITALYPGLIVYSALLMTEPIAALGLVAAALVAARYRSSVKASLVAGVVLGLSTLVRPQSILCAPALGLFAFGQGELSKAAMRRAARSAAVASLTALLVVAPWTVRNCRVMDGCAFVSTNAGWNLAIGSFPRATGRFATLRGSDGCQVVTGQVQQDRCWLRLGWRWIVQDPERWLSLVPKKLGYTLDHESYAIGYLGRADADSWTQERQQLGRGVLSWTHRGVLSVAAFAFLRRPSLARPATWLPVMLLGLLVWFAAMTPSHPFWLVALAIVALAALRWRSLLTRGSALLYGAYSLASLLLIHALFFGEDRYHLVVTPLLCLLAACACGGVERPAAAQQR